MNTNGYALSREHYESPLSAVFWGTCKGHLDQANEGTLGSRAVVHLLIALVEAPPIVGRVASIFEVFIVWYFDLSTEKDDQVDPIPNISEIKFNSYPPSKAINALDLLPKSPQPQPLAFLDLATDRNLTRVLPFERQKSISALSHLPIELILRSLSFLERTEALMGIFRTNKALHQLSRSSININKMFPKEIGIYRTPFLSDNEDAQIAALTASSIKRLFIGTGCQFSYFANPSQASEASPGCYYYTKSSLQRHFFTKPSPRTKKGVAIPINKCIKLPFLSNIGIAKLSRLPLEELYLSGLSRFDGTALSQFPHLKRLSLRECPNINFRALARLPIQELELHTMNLDVQSLVPFRSHPTLRRLALLHNRGGCRSPFVHLTPHSQLLIGNFPGHGAEIVKIEELVLAGFLLNKRHITHLSNMLSLKKITLISCRNSVTPPLRRVLTEEFLTLLREAIRDEIEIEVL